MLKCYHNTSAGTPPPAYQPHDDSNQGMHPRVANQNHNHPAASRHQPTPMDTGMPPPISSLTIKGNLTRWTPVAQCYSVNQYRM